MALVIDFFKKYEDQLVGIGIGSFGPIDIHRDSATYGYITSTPKLAWQNFDFVGTMKQVSSYPHCLDYRCQCCSLWGICFR